MGCRHYSKWRVDFYTARIQNDRYHYLIFESVEYVTQENKDVHILPTKKVEVATFAMILF